MKREEPTLPALTQAECDIVDSYLAIVDLLGRINPARNTDTYRALRAAQALVVRATTLRDTLALMHCRGETEIYSSTLGRALRVLDGNRRSERVVVPERPE